MCRFRFIPVLLCMERKLGEELARVARALLLVCICNTSVLVRYLGIESSVSYVYCQKAIKGYIHDKN